MSEPIIEESDLDLETDKPSSKPRLKIKGKKDLLDRIMSKLKASRPRTEAGGTYDVYRTSKIILSRIKYVITTGIKSFDEITGGLPFGRIVELYGMQSSGKTALAIRSAIRAQQRHVYERVIAEDGKVSLKRIDDDSDVTIFYIDNEQSLDDDDKITLDDEYDPAIPTTKLDAVADRCDTISQMFKAIEQLVVTIKDYEKETGRPQFVVVVVDTIASTSSNEEINAEWGKVDYARQPKQLREGFRKLVRVINRQNVCMICLNQVSDKYAAAKGGGHKSNTPQDEDFDTFGGRALKYYSTLRVFMYRMPSKFCLRPRTQFSDGFVVGFKTTKNRLLKPFREGRMALIFDQGYRDRFSMLETMMFLKFVEYGQSDASFIFKFAQAGITPTTFGKASISLQDEDDEVGTRSKREPRIMSRSEWPSFYEAHKADLDLLWAAAIKKAFTVDESSAADDEVEIDEEG